MNDSSYKGFDIKDILGILRHRKWFLIVPAILITATAYGVSFFLTPKYNSATTVWIDKPANVSYELKRIIGTDARESRDKLNSRQKSLSAELTSQGYLSQLIRELNLADNEDITRQAAKKRESAPDYSLEQIKYVLLYQELKEQIRVRFLSSELFTITVEAEEPVLARDMAMKLTEILEREKSRYELEKILDNQTFTDLQLKKTELSYQEAVDSLNAAKARLSTLRLPENIASESNRLDIISSIDKISLQKNDYEKERDGLQKRLEEFNLQSKRFKYTDSIVELRTTIDRNVSEYAKMMEKYAWSDQNVININIRIINNIKFLEEAINSSVTNQYTTLPENQIELLNRTFIVKENIDILNSKKNRLEQTLSQIDARLNSVPKLESEIIELSNQVASQRKYRDAFKSEETTVSILSEQAKDRTKYRIIEPAQLPLEPFWPDPIKILMMGLLLGLILGGSIIFILELLDNSVKDIENFEEEFGLKVFAAVPEIEKFNIS